MSAIAADPRAAAQPGALLAPIRACAAVAPDADALRWPDGRHSRAELIARVERTAALLRASGVRRDDVVALAAERSADAIVSMLAIVACGGAYLPLDVDFPAARLAAMIEDARPRFALGRARERARLPAGPRWIDLAAADAGAFDGAADADGELVYVLFTSGSTGRPKGVAMRRAAVAPLIGWHCAHARLGRSTRTLQFAPLGFDVSFQEIFSTFATGGTLVLPTESERRDPYALLDLLARERIERLFLPYVGLQALAEAVAAGGAAPAGLRDVITAGEQLRVTQVIRALFAALPGAVLHNHYGPTETHVVTAFELAGDPHGWPELPPIGAPLPHVQVRVVDAALADVAAGGEGELLLGGGCLAAGYVGRPELTAERFVDDVRDARWYRSGDRVRWRDDGVLDYLGRLDAQIKLDGFRVEPAEIEAVLGRDDAVADAAVVAADGAGGRRLVAHVVARDPRAAPAALAAALRAHCERLLAPYLVPQEFVLHAALPLTASGKIDRGALVRDAAAAPLRWREELPLAARLADLWRQLLGADALAVDANVFEHGARSLLVVRLLTELRRRGLVLSAAQVYEHPSAAAQAALLEAAPPRTEVDAGERSRAAAQRAALARFGPRPGGAR